MSGVNAALPTKVRTVVGAAQVHILIHCEATKCASTWVPAYCGQYKCNLDTVFYERESSQEGATKGLGIFRLKYQLTSQTAYTLLLRNSISAMSYLLSLQRYTKISLSLWRLHCTTVTPQGLRCLAYLAYLSPLRLPKHRSTPFTGSAAEPDIKTRIKNTLACAPGHHHAARPQTIRNRLFTYFAYHIRQLIDEYHRNPMIWLCSPRQFQ